MTQPATDDAAACWAIRLDAGNVDARARHELDAWLGESPRHAAALLRAQAALRFLDRGRALAMPDAADAPPASPLGRRRFLAAGTGIAAALVGGFVWAGRGRTIDTGIGELRRVPLDDGSLATLNTSTRVEIAMAERERVVRLEAGEAWFRVAHDRLRPFVVKVGDVRVRAVGTAFSVRRHDHGADVLVTEGTIETWVVGSEAKRRRISSGSRGFVPAVRAEIEVATAPQEIERALAWRSGELALNGETLGFAARELNRYNVRQIVVTDPELEREQLVGYFRTTEPENFARAVAGMIGAQTIVEGDAIRIDKADK